MASFFFRSTSHSFLLAAFFILFSFDQVMAQYDEEHPPEPRIRQMKEFWNLRLTSSQKLFTIGLQDLSRENSPKMEFKPNVSNYLGFGVNMFDIGLEIAFRTKPNEENLEKKGNTTGQDWQVHIYSRRFGADVTYQQYKGFYISNPQPFYPSWNDTTPFPYLPDMRARIIHVGAYYTFNGDKFSFPSSFNQTEIQLQSGGTWLIISQFNSSRLEAPVSLIPQTDTNRFTGLTSLNQVDVSTFSILPGFGYNLVFIEKIYINISLAAGLGYQWRSYQTEERHVNNRVTTAVNWRLGAGYNGRRLFFGANGFLQSSNITVDNLQINADGGFLRFFVGYRWREWGFMRKSVFDLISRKEQ